MTPAARFQLQLARINLCPFRGGMVEAHAVEAVRWQWHAATTSRPSMAAAVAEAGHASGSVMTCKCGHAFTPENTIWYRHKELSQAYRKCKTCYYARKREMYRLHKQQMGA